MYLHIGNNNMVKESDIIAILNIDSIKETVEYKKLIEYLSINHLLIKDNGIEEKSLIITAEKNDIIGYISNISSNTIAKRNNMIK